MSAQLKRQLSECDGVVRRLSKITIAARPASAAAAPEPAPEPVFVPAPAPAPVPSAKAVAAAAQAFSERRRSNGLAA
jgi:hypothetical protein